MANKYVTPSGAGAKTGADWDNAFGLAEFLADTPAGDFYYIYQGTYTITSAKTFAAGTSDAMNKYIGISNQETMALADWDELPIFATGAYIFRFGGYSYCRRIKMTTSTNDGWITGTGSVTEECWGACSGATTFKMFGTDGKLINCYGENFRTVYNEVYCTQAQKCQIYNCVGTSVNGTVFNSIDGPIIGGMAFNSSRGISNKQGAYGVTIKNCGVGIDMYNTLNKGASINCNIVDCGVGIRVNGTSSDKYSFDILNCNLYNNTLQIAEADGTLRDDLINSSCTELDPQFVDAANGNFAIGANLRSKGFPSKFPNLNTKSYVDIGAVQIREVLPAVEDVESGVQYGANGTELTGTLTAGGGEYSYTF